MWLFHCFLPTTPPGLIGSSISNSVLSCTIVTEVANRRRPGAAFQVFISPLRRRPLRERIDPWLHHQHKESICRTGRSPYNSHSFQPAALAELESESQGGDIAF